MACEDGPNQVYQPLPAGAGGIINNGGTDASADPGSAKFDASFGGTSASEICNGPQKHLAWSKAFEQPIKPPRFVAGIDLAGGDNWEGLTVEAAEHGPSGAKPGDLGMLCQSDPQSGYYSWGDNQEIQFTYDASTHKINFMQMFLGYTGTLEFDSRPGSVFSKDSAGADHKYHYIVKLGSQITKDGKPWVMHWAKAGTDGYPQFAHDATELYDALMYTYAPELPSDQVDCIASTKCRAKWEVDDSGNFGARGVGVYFDVPKVTQGEANATTPGDIYIFPVKFLPYSTAAMNIKMDQEGPTAPAGQLGDKATKADCTLHMGMTFKDLMASCVQVLDPAKPENVTANQTAKNKILGNLHHDYENFQFDVVGVNQNYTSTTIDPFDIIHDDQKSPADTDIATDYINDVRANGPVINDCVVGSDGLCKSTDMHGSAAVYREYVRLVYEDVKKFTKSHRPQNDPACLMPSNYSQDKTFNPLTWRPADGCSGFEGAIAPPAIELLANAIPNKSCSADAQCPQHNTVDATDTNVYYRCDTAATLASGDPNPTHGMCVATDSTTAPTNKKWVARTVKMGNYPSLFKPADPLMKFCDDFGAATTGPGGGPLPNDFDAGGNPIFNPAKPMVLNNNHCESVGNGTIWDESLARLTQVLGKGSVSNLPPEMRDRRYFLTKFATAMVRYLINRTGDPKDVNPKVPGITDLIPEQMFFDLLGPGDDKFEYVDRRFVDQNGAPLDIEYELLLSSGNNRQTNFYRRLSREEKGMYEALAEDKTGHKPGFENNSVLITNVVGSGVLQGAYSDSGVPCAGASFPTQTGATVADDAKSRCGLLSGGFDKGTKDAYYCATVQDTDCRLQGNPSSTGSFTANQPPLDVDGTVRVNSKGLPYLVDYKGALRGGTAFTIGSTAIKLVEEKPLLQSYHVSVPSYADPYNPDPSTNPKYIDFLVSPYYPKAPGQGFTVPLTGTRDKSVETAVLDLSGTTITWNFDYLPTAPDKNGNVFAKLMAVETQDFLGEVFICQDPRTGDLLSAHMYSSVGTILDWIASHPGVNDACGIIVRYSPFNNYPDFITSTTNGIKINVTQGAGFGRVSDVTIFDTSVLTQ